MIMDRALCFLIDHNRWNSSSDLCVRQWPQGSTLPIIYTGSTLYLCRIESPLFPFIYHLPGPFTWPYTPIHKKKSTLPPYFSLAQYTGRYPSWYLINSTLSLISLLPGTDTWLYYLCIRRRWLSPHSSLNFSKSQQFPLISHSLNTQVDTQVGTWPYMCVLRKEKKRKEHLFTYPGRYLALYPCIRKGRLSQLCRTCPLRYWALYPCMRTTCISSLPWSILGSIPVYENKLYFLLTLADAWVYTHV
jgi:hypothetical protein